MIRTLHRLLYGLHYSLLFGRSVPVLGGYIAGAARSWEIAKSSADYPAPRETWNLQYRQGIWDCINNLDECARYSAVAGYFQYLKPGGAILDVGCGEGVLNERLAGNYSRYVGVDISEAAIEKCKASDLKSRYVAADAMEYVPDGAFDAIVFNEILYYFEEPLKLLEKYETSLAPDGIYILSLYGLSRRAMAVWKRVRSTYMLQHEVKITTVSGKSWICDVLSPFPKSMGRSLPRYKQLEPLEWLRT